MSKVQNIDNIETLFSFELLVEYIRIEKDDEVSDELALGVRLLDFPTLLIYQPQHRSGDRNRAGERDEEKRESRAFNRGKSCFFQMNLNSLHAHLSDTPLYAMVLDVKEEIPKLIGSSLISLANVMGSIVQDVTEHGVSAPSSHGERRLVDMCNLKGEKIGLISLSYKLLSLGASLLPHLADRRDFKRARAEGGERALESIREKNTSVGSRAPDCGEVQSPTPDGSDVSRNIQNKGTANEQISVSEDKQGDAAACVATERRPRTQSPQTLQETENYFEEDLALFCPPRLYYSNSAEEKSKNKGGDYKLLTLVSDAFAFDESCSEEEMAGNKSDGPSSPVRHQRDGRDAKPPGNQETSGESPNVLGEALRQLPLLNALLVELSQLNGQSPQQPTSVHPSLAWIYGPASAQPPAGHGDASGKTLQRTRRGASPHFKHLHSPRKCSTPIVRPTSVRKRDQHGEALAESKSSSKSPGKKLVYGTTKAFNLRLKHISPLTAKRRECTELIQNETQTSMTKGKAKSKNKVPKPSKRNSALNQSSSLNENIETMIQSVAVDSAPQETTTAKQKNLHGKVPDKHGRDLPRISAELSLSERKGLNRVHVPGVDAGGAARSRGGSEQHRPPERSPAQPDEHREEVGSRGSSGRSSPGSPSSGAGGEGREEADYADDFNSLEPSDAYSPDPVSSPEPCRAKTPRSPVRPDLCPSDSESLRRRAALPVPLRVPGSPQRALRGTHVIRPRTHASALSLSSDDGDRSRAASSQTACSRERMTEGGWVGRGAAGDSFTSWRGQRTESTKSSGPVRASSAESVSSSEPQEAEELEDELGSLDFRKEYQHISDLVASKLPGYTL